MKRRVVITGFGCVCAVGAGREAFWNGIREGRSRASVIREFDTTGLPVRIGYEIAPEVNLDEYIPNRKAIKTMSKPMQVTVAAGILAARDARLEPQDYDPERIAVIAGVPGVGHWGADDALELWSTLANLGARMAPQKPGIPDFTVELFHQSNPITILKHLPNFAATHLSIFHGARGECSSIATSCTSSLQAIGDAFRLIRHGYADMAIAGGGDSPISPQGMYGFTALGVLSRRNDDPERACRPFDKDRDGMVLGDGGAVVILETPEAARKRGARVLAEIVGYACTQDAFRLTDEPPDARGSILAMRRAIADACLRPEQIDYVNAHGTSTPMNDVTETLAIHQVFGEHARRLAVSSVKSITGHLLAGAGAIELGACLFALETQTFPPTVNLANPDPRCDLDYVIGRPRPGRIDTILKNSFGFGGQNACMVLRRYVP